MCFCSDWASENWYGCNNSEHFFFEGGGGGGASSLTQRSELCLCGVYWSLAMWWIYHSSHRKKTALSCYYGVADIFDHELDINFCYKLFFLKLICTLCSD